MTSSTPPTKPSTPLPAEAGTTSSAASSGATVQISTPITSVEAKSALAQHVLNKLGPIAATKAAKTAAQPKMARLPDAKSTIDDVYVVIGLQPALTEAEKNSTEG